MSLSDFLNQAVNIRASDIFIIAGLPVSCKRNNELATLVEGALLPKTSEALIKEIYNLANRDINHLLQTGDDDFSFSVAGLSRFRVSTYKQRGSLAAVIRIISFGIPNYNDLNIPEQVMDISNFTKGLVIVAGTAGSGKSTTLACIIDHINQARSGHIITLEEPIEFLHKNRKSIVSQREIPLDTASYVTAIRSCLRQAPDVILVGEMRDYETIQTAMTAAETGHLVISTLHTVGAANTIDRIIDVFPPMQQQQIRIQLSMLLKAVVSQQLIPKVQGGIHPVFEVMAVNNAIRTMIRESKTHQLDNVIASSASEGMVSMDSSLLSLFKQGIIDKENVIRYATNQDSIIKKLN